MSLRVLLLTLAAPAIVAAEEQFKPTNESEPEDRLITEDINLPNIDGNQLARLFEKFTGKKVMVSGEAVATRFTLIQKASSGSPLSYQKAANLVLMSALVENFEFITDPKNPNSRSLRALQSKGPGCVEKIEVYNRTTSLPTDDSVIHYVMELRHADTKEALEILESKRDKSKEYAAIVAIPNSAAILIVDRVSVVRQLIDLHSEFDQLGSNTKSKPMPGGKADQ